MEATETCEWQHVLVTAGMRSGEPYWAVEHRVSPQDDWERDVTRFDTQSAAMDYIARFEADEGSGTTQKPDEGVTQADLDRGEELDEKYGWSKGAAPDGEPEWPVMTVLKHRHSDEAGEPVTFDFIDARDAPQFADPAEPDFSVETYYPSSHAAVLSEEDGKRLDGIAGNLELAIADGRIHPDFGARDVRYLRKLATYAKGDPDGH